MASRDALTISRASKSIATGKESLVPGKVEWKVEECKVRNVAWWGTSMDLIIFGFGRKNQSHGRRNPGRSAAARGSSRN